jgi:hypothetical protein
LLINFVILNNKKCISVYSPKTLIFAFLNQKRDMNLIDFIKAFPDEGSCQAKFKAYREHVGVVCPKCGHREHY